MKIDAHQHFWSYDPVQYDWIGEDMRAIRRDFLPADLAPLAARAGISGTVAVQARQTLAETAGRVARTFGWDLPENERGFLADSLPRWRPFPIPILQ